MDRTKKEQDAHNYLQREKTRIRKRLGEAPARGMGRIKCEICGKPLSKHTIMKLCDG